MVSEFDAPRPEFEYDNQLSPERQRELVGQLLKERPPKTNGPFAYYEVSRTSAYANVARTIEAQVFAESEVFGESAGETAELYGPYEDQSIFLLAIDVMNTKPAGALRVIENGKNGFLTFNDLAEPQNKHKEAGDLDIDDTLKMHGISELAKCWDVGTIAVLPEYRKRTTPVSVMLYRAMYKKARENDVDHLISIIDKNPLDKVMRPYLGIPFGPLGGLDEPFKYYGSKLSYAVHGYVPEFFQKMLWHQFTTQKGWLATASGALTRLVEGTRDKEIDLLAA